MINSELVRTVSNCDTTLKRDASANEYRSNLAGPIQLVAGYSEETKNRGIVR
jgi:hypothetical protein